MLFYLSDSLIVSDEDPEYSKIMLTVRNIANQAINKIHYVLGSINAISYFRDKFKSEMFLGTFFNRIYQNFSILPIPAFIDYYIEVTRNDNYTFKSNGRIVNRMSYDNFMNSDSLQKTTVLGESYNDSEFYEHILRCFRSKMAPHVNYSLHTLPGNGKQTQEIIEKEKNSKHILVCIVDSDKKFPTDIPKSTSTCSICSEIPETPIYHLVVLDVQEVENLIPLNYIDNLDWKSFNRVDRLNKRNLDYLRVKGNYILPFYDYKCGIKKTQELLSSSQDYTDYAETCFNLNEDLTKRYKDFTSLLNDKNFKDELIPRLFSGTVLITSILAMIRDGRQPKPELLPFQKQNWNKIGHILLNWCIAENKDATI